MDYLGFMNSLKREVISPLYIFEGTEKLLMNQMITKVKEKFLPEEVEAFNFDYVEGDKVSLKQIVDLANTMPIMSDKRIVVIENPPFIMTVKNKEEKGEEKFLLEYLKNPNLSTCLILKVIGKVDKRKKIYKEMQSIGQIIDFQGLNREKMEQWILNYLKQRNVKIDAEALSYLIIVGGEGLEFLTNELDKIILYVQDEKITLDVVQNLVAKTSEINIFHLIDNIANKQGKKALEQLNISLSMGEAPLKLIHLLVRQFRMIIIAKDLLTTGYSEKQIREKLEQAPFIVSKVIGQGRKFSIEELIISLEYLLDTETKLKSSGGLTRELMENLVIKLCYQ
ncbi:DNA polymerase III, delta subunit [Desulfonispora thiosulfatigenes DSM 11270]|uniref:DNA polymerase III subunit delta n=1 Tax=Desulfonispora thiosulfatigenes DSM 11270 TaxID=656914 RepID=A0A1W1VBV9_DESTI|nr:DNA polymerase III subunit delta [Desulfonispora thiosulfatigenes]SMB90832.1 DNA polymerase III, delta subunit [Desulfonispora thiosulfatigenes DSM 11270]